MMAQRHSSCRDQAALLPRGVRRALDAMRATRGRKIHIAEFAAVACVSTRTLQRQFRNFLGQTPRAALRDIRFEAARRDLLRGAPRATVADVAQRCGFTHLGRFSVEYRRRYAEQPSQTLQRQALFIAAQSKEPQLLSLSVDRPRVTVEPIEASAGNEAIAREAADELARALARAGAGVTCRPELAHYRVLGALRGEGMETRLTFRLIEAASGRHLWAHRHDCAGREALAFEEHDATKIAAAIQPCLRAAEIDYARQKPDADLTAYDLTLRAMPHVLALDRDGNARAHDLLERAMDRDPGHALAVALAAWSHVQRVVYHFTETPVEERERATALAQRALTLDGNATVMAVLGNALTSLRDLEAADLVIRKALSLDGSSAWAWSRSGWVDVYNGRAESAIERFNIALELAPYDPLAFNNFVGLGCAHFHVARYADAAHWQERAVVEHPSAAWVHRTLVPAYALGGRELEAQRSLAALRRHYPELTASQVPGGLPPLPQSYCDRVLEGLEAVGLPR